VLATDPTQLPHPTFLMNYPFSFAIDAPNNVWMREAKGDELKLDLEKAGAQWGDLYGTLAADSLVYILPTPAEALGLQDLVFTANLGVTMEHTGQVVLSNFTATERVGEAAVGKPFLQSMNLDVLEPAAKFEGEADLKHLHDNVYVGGYGQRSSRVALDWIAEQTDAIILPVQLQDEYLYHLDCSVFPLTATQTMVCCDMFEEDELGVLDEETEVIDVSEDAAYSGICNSVRVHNVIVNHSNIHDLKRGTEDYQLEVKKNRELEDIAAKMGFEVCYVNISELAKGGAMLSCLVMHLNRWSYGVDY